MIVEEEECMRGPNPKHVSSEVSSIKASSIKANGAFSHLSVDRIAS